MKRIVGGVLGGEFVLLRVDTETALVEYSTDGSVWKTIAGGSGSSGTGSVSWNDVTGKPETFPPDDHNHEISDVNGLQDALDNAGAVKTVNGVGPDDSGNVTIETTSVAVDESRMLPVTAANGTIMWAYTGEQNTGPQNMTDFESDEWSCTSNAPYNDSSTPAWQAFRKYDTSGRGGWWGNESGETRYIEWTSKKGPKLVNKLTVSFSSGEKPRSMVLQGSNDGTLWTRIYDSNTIDWNGNSSVTLQCDNTQSYYKYRLYFVDNTVTLDRIECFGIATTWLEVEPQENVDSVVAFDSVSKTIQHASLNRLKIALSSLDDEGDPPVDDDGIYRSEIFISIENGLLNGVSGVLLHSENPTGEDAQNKIIWAGTLGYNGESDRLNASLSYADSKWMLLIQDSTEGDEAVSATFETTNSVPWGAEWTNTEGIQEQITVQKPDYRIVNSFSDSINLSTNFGVFQYIKMGNNVKIYSPDLTSENPLLLVKIVRANRNTPLILDEITIDESTSQLNKTDILYFQFGQNYKHIKVNY